jgi:hypothetical protein
MVDATVFNYIATRGTADKLIQQFGMKASLVRGGVFRDAWICMVEYLPKDAQSQLANPTDRQVLISAGLGGVPGLAPDWTLDQLVTYVQPATVPPVQNEVLPFTMPIKPISPAGVVVLYQTTVKR